MGIIFDDSGNNLLQTLLFYYESLNPNIILNILDFIHDIKNIKYRKKLYESFLLYLILNEVKVLKVIFNEEIKVVHWQNNLKYFFLYFKKNNRAIWIMFQCIKEIIQI